MARTSEIAHEHRFGRVSLVLSTIALALIVFYLFISNFIVSQKYALNAARLELGGVSVDLAVEGSGEAMEPAITKIINYAQNSGMIEARATDSIVEDSGFAVSIPGVQ